MDVRLAVTGFGNVGQGIAQILQEQGKEYLRRHGVRLVLTSVADRGGAVTDENGLDPAVLLSAKVQTGTIAAVPGGVRGLQGSDLLDATRADVLIEAASTNFEDAEPGWTYAREALRRGMDVVLASKGALVVHWDALMEEAGRGGRRVLFSGTTGAPLPVLELADRALIGARPDGFEGIVNATTNVILTLMGEGMSFDDGVRAAQEAGLAETDPTLDVDGWDAAAKALIISRAVLGAKIALNEVQRTGIRGVTATQLEQARLQGHTIKLIARVTARDGIVRATVGPEARPLADPLGSLRDQQMGIIFHTAALGAVTSSVQRSGGIPTALTVLRDVVNLARDRRWTSQE